jgi:hypothetical protein
MYEEEGKIRTYSRKIRRKFFLYLALERNSLKDEDDVWRTKKKREKE